MKKKIFGLVMTSLTLLTIVTGCSSNDSSKEKNTAKQDMTPYGKYESPVTFTIGRGLYTEGKLPSDMTVEDNVGTRYVEKMANIKAEVAWEAQDTDQKIALSISTGDIPDVMIVNREQFKQLVDNDLIEDMTEVYEKTASGYIKDLYGTFGDIIFDQVTVDGKLMGIPSTNISGQQDLLWIRKDWLEKLGLKLPQTKEDVYNIAKAFVENDMSGDGKTVGLSMNTKIAGTYNAGWSLNPIFYANHSYPRQWIEKDGKTVYGTIQLETKATLEELSRLYKDGILDRQFAVRKNDELKTLVANGNLGILGFPWWAPYSDLQQALANDPNADWVPVSAPEDENGNVNVTQQDPIMNIVVVKKGFSHPEAIMKSINLSQDLIYQLTPEAKKYTEEELSDYKDRWSHLLVQIPGQWDYNDVTKRIYDNITEAINSRSTENLRLDMIPVYNHYLQIEKEGNKDLAAWADVRARLDGEKASFDERIKTVNVNFFDKTESMKTTWANLEKLEDEMFVKIITGEEPISYFDEFVKQWEKIGGSQVTEEVNKEVKK